MSRFCADIILKVALAILIAYLIDLPFQTHPVTSWTSRFSVVKQMGGLFSRMFSWKPSSTTSGGTLTHFKCRNTNYPRSDKCRFEVPDQFVKWETSFVDYKPPFYTADGINGKPWADPEVIADSSVWNRVDSVSKVDRTSYVKEYNIIDGIPQNPVGRTGMRGRGILGRWGPNHAADPIVTRWKVDEQGGKTTHSKTGCPILQFIAIQRKDSGEWAIPGGMVDPGEVVTSTLRREFAEEAMNSLEADEELVAALNKKIDEFFATGFEVYRGYVDDPRNTDNAWMETVAYNFHDEKGDCVGRFKLHAGDDAVGVKWMDVDQNVKLYASHADMIKTVAEHHKAHW